MGVTACLSLRAWLRAPGSLTARLARHGRLEVQLLRQAVAHGSCKDLPPAKK